MADDLINRIEKFGELPTDQKWIAIQDALLTLLKKEPKKKGKK